MLPSFDAVYRMLIPRLRAFFLRRTHQRAEAEDLVQDTLLRAYAARDSFVPDADVVCWVFAIARHRWIDHGRSRRLSLQPLDVEIESGEPRSDAVLEAREMGDRLRGVFALLPDDQRVAFVLVRQEGLSVSDAASRLGTTPSAVKLRTFRATKALREAARRACRDDD